ncbi:MULTISPECIES: hypothetical protein [Chryseobacterium]|uniref:Permuted papain-like amidase YaeF/Yiix C92 family enzyme n=1 Tax=Chryseobacterium geocarposphaerae TaxID=1416776 RepID=A0ABU1LBE4_9FLAO|nr:MULTISPECIES: hypothetical protein [Chryseobacterium]MDR6403940.1 hypothetical protein [Chryseobacterium geocarposphaerae]MDR6698541.1 hypothetical protein [Chryseobacterium ginsenosidimutans]
MVGKNFNYHITIVGSILIIVIFSFYGYKSSSLNSKIKGLQFDTESIYLVQRGATGKLSNVAKDFNISNKYASHVGIGFVKDRILTIHHVYVDKNSQNSYLYVESINDFINPKDINYLSIWKLKDIDHEKFNHIKNTLIHSEKENIIFDFTFAENNKKYYCSEYIVSELRKNGIEIMKDHKKNVTGMIKQILKKDTLKYFPVDGFENTGKAEKVFEWIK